METNITTLDKNLALLSNFKQQADEVGDLCLQITITDETTLAIGQSAGASKKSTSTDWGKSLSNISNSKLTSGNRAGSRPKTSTSSNITKKNTADLGLSTLPSLSLSDTDKFNTWANEYGGSNLVMSPNQKNVKDGYVLNLS